jgi:uncharacterized membrane protein
MISKEKKIFWWLVIAAQLFIYGPYWYRADKTTTDFPAFHATALIWKAGRQPYDLENQCRVEKEVNPAQPCLPFAHPPILLPLMALAANSDYVSSYWRWTLITAIILLLGIIPLFLLTRDLPLSVQSILFFPAMFGLWMGQDNAIVLLAVLLFVLLLKTDKDFLAGLALSLGAVKPQLLLVLGIPLLFSRRQAFLGFCTGCTVLLLYGVLLVGVEGLGWILALTTLMSKIQGFGVWPEGMYNVTGILARAGLNHFWSWPTYVLAILGTCVLWKRKGLTPSTISIAIVVTVFTAPHVHLWDLSLLIIPLLTLHRLGLVIGSLIIVAAFPFGRTYLVTYLMMFGLAVLHFRKLNETWSTTQTQ